MDIALQPNSETADSGAVKRSLSAADTACRERGLLFTHNRAVILETLLRSAQPLSAYEILRSMQARLGRRVSPPTVYRALDFLLELGFATKIATRNVYVAAMRQPGNHFSTFFICETCGSTSEVKNSKLDRLFEEDADGLGFHIGSRVIEFQGTCATCHMAKDAADEP